MLCYVVEHSDEQSELGTILYAQKVVACLMEWLIMSLIGIMCLIECNRLSCSKEESHRLAMSQPDHGTSRTNLEWSGEAPDAEDGRFSICFSQPVHLDHMLLGSQIFGTPGASQVNDSCSPD